jgi:hypothetical protein
VLGSEKRESIPPVKFWAHSDALHIRRKMIPSERDLLVNYQGSSFRFSPKPRGDFKRESTSHSCDSKRQAVLTIFCRPLVAPQNTCTNAISVMSSIMALSAAFLPVCASVLCTSRNTSLDSKCKMLEKIGIFSKLPEILRDFPSSTVAPRRYD